MLFKKITDPKGRYVLRELEQGDGVRLAQMNQDLFFALLRHEYQPDGFLREAIQHQSQQERSNYFLGIADIQTHELVGCIMLFNKQPLMDGKNSIEIGYFVDPCYQNIRCATDATAQALAVLQHPLSISEIIATVDPANKPSRKVLRHLGFQRTGFIRESKYLGDPDISASYDREGNLKYWPRLVAKVDIETFFSRAAREIVNHTPENLDEKLQIARIRLAARLTQKPTGKICNTSIQGHKLKKNRPHTLNENTSLRAGYPMSMPERTSNLLPIESIPPISPYLKPA